MAAPEQVPFSVEAADGTRLVGWSQGEGPVIVLVHGVTAHRDLVLHGSRHLLRAGFRLVAYDARGHGESGAGPAGSYRYGTLADDLELVCAAQGGGRPLLCGHSMGAHTTLVAALRDSGRYAGMVLIGPVSLGAAPSARTLAGWDALADGLDAGGVEGWLRAYEAGGLNVDWR